MKSEKMKELEKNFLIYRVLEFTKRSEIQRKILISIKAFGTTTTGFLTNVWGGSRLSYASKIRKLKEIGIIERYHGKIPAYLAQYFQMMQNALGRDMLRSVKRVKVYKIKEEYKDILDLLEITKEEEETIRNWKTKIIENMRK